MGDRRAHPVARGGCPVLLFKQKNNLIKPMLHGDKSNVGAAAPSRDDALSRLVALFVLGACAGAVTWLVKLGG